MQLCIFMLPLWLCTGFGLRSTLGQAPNCPLQWMIAASSMSTQTVLLASAINSKTICDGQTSEHHHEHRSKHLGIELAMLSNLFSRQPVHSGIYVCHRVILLSSKWLLSMRIQRISGIFLPLALCSFFIPPPTSKVLFKVFCGPAIYFFHHNSKAKR